MVNALVDANLPVPAYRAISALPSTEPPLSHTPVSLTHIDCYMDDVISVVKGGGADRKNRVFESKVRALKWLSTSPPGEAKDSLLVKNLSKNTESSKAKSVLSNGFPHHHLVYPRTRFWSRSS